MQLVYEGSSDTVALITLGHKDQNSEWVNIKTEIYDRNEIKALTKAWMRFRRCLDCARKLRKKIKS